MTCAGKTFFFIVHVLLHVFGYLLPRSIRLIGNLLIFKPCRDAGKKHRDFIWRPEREVRVVHHPTDHECVEEVFGLMDVHAHPLEDRQFCWDDAPHDERAELNKRVKECMLEYSSPLYTGHITTIAGSFRPKRKVDYKRVQLTAWDGCPLVHDWLYVEGEEPDDEGLDVLFVENRKNTTTTTTGSSAAMNCGETRPRSAISQQQQQNHRKEEPSWMCAHSPTPRDDMGGGITSSSSNHNESITSSGGRRGVIADDESHEPLADFESDHYYREGKDEAGNRQEQNPAASSSTPGFFLPFQFRRPQLSLWRGNDSNESSTVHSEAASSCTVEVRIADAQNAESHHDTQNRQQQHQGEERKGETRGSSEKVKGIVFIVPGLSSHSQSNYVISFAFCMQKRGYHCYIANTRGLGNAPLTTPFLFNGGYTRDIRTTLQTTFNKEAIIRRFGRPLSVIGVGLSIGGAKLSKYLGEQGRSGSPTFLDAAVTFCSPNDFVRVVEHMNRGTYQKTIYQENMCEDVRNYILKHKPLQEMPNVDNDWVIRKGNIKRFSRIIHFDQHIIAKSAGYRSMHHYHLDASAITWLPYTPIPTLVFSSFDDPVIGRSVMPHRWKEIVLNNPRVVYVEPHAGGHLGFLGGPFEELVDKENWMERFAADRFDAISEYWTRMQEHPERSHGLMQVLAFKHPAQQQKMHTQLLPHNDVASNTRTNSQEEMMEGGGGKEKAPRQVTTAIKLKGVGGSGSSVALSEDRAGASFSTNGASLARPISAEDLSQHLRLIEDDGKFIVLLNDRCTGNSECCTTEELSPASPPTTAAAPRHSGSINLYDSGNAQSSSSLLRKVAMKGDIDIGGSGRVSGLPITNGEYLESSPPADRANNACYFAHPSVPVMSEYPTERLCRPYFQPQSLSTSAFTPVTPQTNGDRHPHEVLETALDIGNAWVVQTGSPPSSPSKRSDNAVQQQQTVSKISISSWLNKLNSIKPSDSNNHHHHHQQQQQQQPIYAYNAEAGGGGGSVHGGVSYGNGDCNSSGVQQQRFLPVVSNCDFVVDPRLCMQKDL